MSALEHQESFQSILHDILVGFWEVECMVLTDWLQGVYLFVPAGNAECMAPAI